MKVEIPDEICGALVALAALADRDEPDVDELVGLVLADWLAARQEQVTVAAAALAAVFPPVIRAVADDVHGIEWVPAVFPAQPDRPAPPVARLADGDGYPCSVGGCDFVGKSKQALGGHRSTGHRKGAKAAKKRPAAAATGKSAPASEPAADAGDAADTSPAAVGWTVPERIAQFVRPLEVPAASIPAVSCEHCGGRAVGGKKVQGRAACVSCWRNAGRPGR